MTRSRLKRIDWATPYDGSAEDESKTPLPMTMRNIFQHMSRFPRHEINSIKCTTVSDNGIISRPFETS